MVGKGIRKIYGHRRFPNTAFPRKYHDNMLNIYLSLRSGIFFCHGMPLLKKLNCYYSHQLSFACNKDVEMAAITHSCFTLPYPVSRRRTGFDAEYRDSIRSIKPPHEQKETGT